MANRKERRASDNATAVAGKLCAYCGVRPATTRDHVFAQCFFPKPRPTPILAPVCVECNSGRGDGGQVKLSLDEEYTRNVICMMKQSQAHPMAVQLANGPVNKSLQRSPMFAQSFLNSLRPVWEKVPFGIAPTGFGTLEVKPDRVFRVIRKITRGLYYWHLQHPLRPECRILVHWIKNLDQFNGFHAFMKKLPMFGPVTMGQEIVIYKGARTMREWDETVWLMAFFNRVAFCSITVGPDFEERMATATKDS